MAVQEDPSPDDVLRERLRAASKSEREHLVQMIKEAGGEHSAPDVDQGSTLKEAVANQLDPASSEEADSTSTSDYRADSPSMNREELEAKLKAQEAKVYKKKAEIESMVEKVSSSYDRMEGKIDDYIEKMDARDEKIEAKLGEFKSIDEKIESNTSWSYYLSIITLSVISLVLTLVGIIVGILTSGGG